ncbi:MAG: glycosyltransferase [Sphingobium sp.]
MVNAARNAHIPTIFWNREDGVHFDRFIESARLFDTIFTVDETMLPKYREQVEPGTRTGVMMFAAEPSIHYPRPATAERRASFVGSYGTHVHDGRRVWQDAIFQAASEIGLTVHDRNSGRRPAHYRYPDYPWIRVENAIPYAQTADVYRRHAVNLNVNTIMGSPTAFSRRLVEILACGAFAVTNPTPAVKRLFDGYCRTVEGEEDARELFARIARDGLSKDDEGRARAGADYVLSHHTWANRLAQILEAVE